MGVYRDVNVKKVYRIYKKLGMQLRQQTPKRRVKAKLRDYRDVGVDQKAVGVMNLVHDQAANGKWHRVLTVVDTFSRYVRVLEMCYRYLGEDVVATLDSVCRATCYPKTKRVDQGSEFVSRGMDLWPYQRGVVLPFSSPGILTNNAFVEVFNCRFCDE